MTTATGPDNVERIGELVSSMCAGEAPVWVGWHSELQWVILDRSIEFNRAESALTEFLFIKVADWSLVWIDRDEWRDGIKFTFSRTLLLQSEDSVRRSLAPQLESICRIFLRNEERLKQMSVTLYEEKHGALSNRLKIDSERTLPANPAFANAHRALQSLMETVEKLKKERIAVLAELRSELLKRQRAEAGLIYAFCAERKIQNLVHFTRVENIKDILRRGLLPRSELKGAKYVNDDARYDGLTESSSLSVSFPNYLMFYKCRKTDESVNWAVIKYGVDILVEVPVIYFPTNAASRRFNLDGKDQWLDRSSLAGLACLFQDEPPGNKRNLSLPPSWPTDPQAELLAMDVVASRYITGISLLKTDPEISDLIRRQSNSIEVGVGGTLFEARADHRQWRSANEAKPASRGGRDTWLPF